MTEPSRLTPERVTAIYREYLQELVERALHNANMGATTIHIVVADRTKPFAAREPLRTLYETTGGNGRRHCPVNHQAAHDAAYASWENGRPGQHVADLPGASAPYGGVIVAVAGLDQRANSLLATAISYLLVLHTENDFRPPDPPYQPEY